MTRKPMRATLCFPVVAGILMSNNAYGKTAEQLIAFDCPVTEPNGVSNTGKYPGGNHGNDALITGLWPEGKVVFEPGRAGFVLNDGSLAMKFWWWRVVEGELTFKGRRLDGPAPPLRASVPSGYGNLGFQATSLIFPTPGCWEVTGRIGDGSLTFVTLVEKIGDGPCSVEHSGENNLIGRLTTTNLQEGPITKSDNEITTIRATGERDYEGGITGTSVFEFEIARQPDDTANFVGHEKITGTIREKTGGFVIEHRGTIDNDGIARSTWEVVPESGTGELANIAGHGTYSSGREGRACYTLALVDS